MEWFLLYFVVLLFCCLVVWLFCCLVVLFSLHFFCKLRFGVSTCAQPPHCGVLHWTLVAIRGPSQCSQDSNKPLVTFTAHLHWDWSWLTKKRFLRKQSLTLPLKVRRDYTFQGLSVIGFSESYTDSPFTISSKAKFMVSSIGSVFYTRKGYCS